MLPYIFFKGADIFLLILNLILLFFDTNIQGIVLVVTFSVFQGLNGQLIIKIYFQFTFQAFLYVFALVFIIN